jgi:hypothetical protein
MLFHFYVFFEDLISTISVDCKSVGQDLRNHHCHHAYKVCFRNKVCTCVSIHVRWGSSPQHGTFSGCGCRKGLQLWRLAVNILNKQPRTNFKWRSSSLGAGRGPNNSSPLKINLLWKLLKSLGPGWIIWIKDPSYAIWIWDLVHGMLEVCIGQLGN